MFPVNSLSHKKTLIVEKEYCKRSNIVYIKTSRCSCTGFKNLIHTCSHLILFWFLISGAIMVAGCHGAKGLRSIRQEEEGQEGEKGQGQEKEEVDSSRQTIITIILCLLYTACC